MIISDNRNDYIITYSDLNTGWEAISCVGGLEEVRHHSQSYSQTTGGTMIPWATRLPRLYMRGAGIETYYACGQSVFDHAI